MGYFTPSLPSGPPLVIQDEDMDTDCDGCGGSNIILALANAGLCTPLAFVSNSSFAQSAPMLAAMLSHSGRSAVPVGAYKGTDMTNTSTFAEQVTNSFGTNGDSWSNYPLAVPVLRQALASSPGGVIYIGTGFNGNIQALLQSPPDGISPLTGMLLVAAKVAKFVITGGDYPTSASPEHNFSATPAAIATAQYFVANSPVPIEAWGYTPGSTFSPVPGGDPRTNPFSDAFSLHGGTAAWDMMTSHYAITGLGSLYAYGGQNGTCTVDSSGICHWSSSPGTFSYMVKAASDATILTALENVMRLIS